MKPIPVLLIRIHHISDNRKIKVAHLVCQRSLLGLNNDAKYNKKGAGPDGPTPFFQASHRLMDDGPLNIVSLNNPHQNTTPLLRLHKKGDNARFMHDLFGLDDHLILTYRLGHSGHNLCRLKV